ncbi:MAG TPA: hypothetical protein DCM01_14385 [Dielma fastidiosa]|nr:hypothetical protein [Dielma fastidiosa]
MIRIAICDDDVKVLAALKDYLHCYAKEKNMQLNVILFQNGIELLKHDIKNIDMIFLDVEMPEINGIELARQIRQVNTQVMILFVTNYIQYALQGYEVQAFRYLIKPINQAEFNQTVTKALDQIWHQQNAYLAVKTRFETIRVRIDTIYYVETEKGHVMIHTEDEIIECYSTMEKIETVLREEGFFRCHNAFLVALKAVKKVQLNDIVLNNGTVIALSKNRKKQFKQVYTDFLGGNFL